MLEEVIAQIAARYPKLFGQVFHSGYITYQEMLSQRSQDVEEFAEQKLTFLLLLLEVEGL